MLFPYSLLSANWRWSCSIPFPAYRWYLSLIQWRYTATMMSGLTLNFNSSSAHLQIPINYRSPLNFMHWPLTMLLLLLLFSHCKFEFWFLEWLYGGANTCLRQKWPMIYQLVYAGYIKIVCFAYKLTKCRCIEKRIPFIYTTQWKNLTLVATICVVPY